jgi:hypothetical protein
VAADVTVSFGAETSGLDAAIAKIKAEAKGLDPAMVELGAKMSAAFKKIGLDPGKAFGAMDPKEQQALAQYGASLEKVTEGTKKLGEESKRTGINIESMMERMAIRFAIFEALRLALQGVKYVIDEISNVQQAQIQFQGMSEGLDHLGARFQYLKEQTAAAFLPIEKGVQIQRTLEDYGASADQASTYVKDLGQWSKILGVDADKLAESLGRVAQGEGSLQDMRLVTDMMGDQAAAGRQLVQTYIDLQKAQKNLEIESASVDQAMSAMMRGMEKAAEEGERHLSRHQAFTEKIITAQAEWDRAHGRETRTSAQVMTQAFEARAGLGGVPGAEVMLQPRGGFRGPMIPKAELAEYQQGIAAIAKEQGISQSAVHTLIRQQVLDYHDVLAAAKEAHQDQMRNLQDADQARKTSMELGKTTAAGAVAAQKAVMATALPQAVTAPPAALFEAYRTSIKGVGDQIKQSIDDGIQTLLESIIKVVTSSGNTAANTENLYHLFSSGT